MTPFPGALLWPWQSSRKCPGHREAPFALMGHTSTRHPAALNTRMMAPGPRPSGRCSLALNGGEFCDLNGARAGLVTWDGRPPAEATARPATSCIGDVLYPAVPRKFLSFPFTTQTCSPLKRFHLNQGGRSDRWRGHPGRPVKPALFRETPLSMRVGNLQKQPASASALTSDAHTRHRTEGESGNIMWTLEPNSPLQRPALSPPGGETLATFSAQLIPVCKTGRQHLSGLHGHQVPVFGLCNFLSLP